MTQCILHIGTRKTASTSVQVLLKHNAQRLLQMGFWVPRTVSLNGFEVALASDMDRKKQWFYAERENVKSYSVWQDYRERFIAALAAEAEDHSGRTLIVSSEDLSHFTRDEEVEHVKSLFDFVTDFKVIVYLRRQDRYLLSDNSTSLLTGGPGLNLDVSETRIPQLDYLALLDAWSNVFGPENLIVRRFDQKHLMGGDLVADFCAVAGLPLEKLERRDDHSNPSINAAGQRFMAHANQTLPRFERSNLHTYIQKICAGRAPKPARFDAQRFQARYTALNKEISKRYFQGEDVFDDDFSDYPEVAEIEDLSFEDAADIMIELWKTLMSQGRV